MAKALRRSRICRLVARGTATGTRGRATQAIRSRGGVVARDHESDWAHGSRMPHSAPAGRRTEPPKVTHHGKARSIGASHSTDFDAGSDGLFRRGIGCPRIGTCRFRGRRPACPHPPAAAGHPPVRAGPRAHAHAPAPAPTAARSLDTGLTACCHTADINFPTLHRSCRTTAPERDSLLRHAPEP